jgi:hypothetical protein
MWSDKYQYLNIARDLRLSERYPTFKLVEFLGSLKELKQTSSFRFKNSSSLSSFLDIQLLKAKGFDSWSENDADASETNLLAIVCAKGDESEFEAVKNLLIRIADHLGWQLFSEETDDGEEDVVLWAPTGAN